MYYVQGLKDYDFLLNGLRFMMGRVYVLFWSLDIFIFIILLMMNFYIISKYDIYCFVVGLLLLDLI